MFINEENDKLYIHGGRNIQNDFSGLYIFDLINYEWSFKKFDSFWFIQSIIPRISHGTILKNDQLYCFGGKKKNFNLFLNNFEIFDLKNEDFVSKPMNIVQSPAGNTSLLLTHNGENEVYFFNTLMNHKINLVQNGNWNPH
jgi:hypothetical protein